MTARIRTVKEQREVLRRRRDLARSFASRLKDELADNLQSVVLFDWVFGPSDPEDVQVVIVTLQDDKRSSHSIFDIATDLSLENSHGLTLTPTSITGEDLERRARAGYPDDLKMLREGNVLYDTGFFQRIRTRELSKGSRNVG